MRRLQTISVVLTLSLLFAASLNAQTLNGNPNATVTTGDSTTSTFRILNSSSTELFRVQADGKVGIGITPTMKLSIGGGGQIFGVDNRATFAAKNGIATDGSGTYESYLWPRFDNVMYLNYGSGGFNIRNNSSATKMFMDNAGNVAIGIYASTLSPGAKLDVSGSARFGYDFPTMPPPTYGGIEIGQYGGGALAELQLLTNANSAGYGFRFRGDYDAYTGSMLLERRWNSGTWSKFMSFNSYGVGIGITFPTALLQIGATDSTTPASFVDMAAINGTSGVYLNMPASSEIHVANLEIGTLAIPVIQTTGGTNSPLYLNKDSDNDVIIGGNPTPHGHGLQVQSTGMSNFAGSVTVTGTLTAGTVYANYQDVAEWVPASESMSPGTVVVISDNINNTVTASTRAYDTGVAGVVSSSPGLLLGVAGSAKAKIATTGRVKVRVEASTQPIRIGDLLVTSDRTGMAMKSEPLDLGGTKIHRPGTLIGKALEPLANGEGEILVLLSLQ